MTKSQNNQTTIYSYWALFGSFLSKEDNPIQDNGETVHKIKDEESTGEEDNKLVHEDDPSIETVDNDDEEESRVSNKQPNRTTRAITAKTTCSLKIA